MRAPAGTVAFLSFENAAAADATGQQQEE